MKSNKTAAKSAALITGASSGIGWELAHVFARHGHSLILTARSEEQLQFLKSKLEKEFSVTVTVVVQDLSLPNAARTLIDSIHNLNLQFSILVNNAGFGESCKFEKSNPQNNLNMIQLNMVALTELTHASLPILKNQSSPKILNVSSVGAFFPGPYMAVYYATKAYVQSFSEAIHEELKTQGVAVCTLCPGPTESGFQSRAGFNSASQSATAKDVAEYGYQSLMKNKAVAIHGWTNRLVIFLMRFTPRHLSRRMVMKVLKERIK